MSQPYLILASSSQIRAKILQNAGLALGEDFQQIPASIDETKVKNAWLKADFAELALALARLKGQQISAQYPENIVIGCDQILACAGARIDKPKDLDELRQQFQKLSGKKQQLYTAIAVFQEGQQIWQHIVTINLQARSYDTKLTEAYIDRFGPDLCNSAGGCRVEDMGIQLFSEIEGDYFAILGLPLLPLLNFLRPHLPGLLL